MAWVTNVMQMWCKCFVMMMKNLASSALSFMYYKMQYYTKKVIILFDFLLGLCVVLNFFFPILCILVLKDDVWRLVNIVLFPYCR